MEGFKFFFEQTEKIYTDQEIVSLYVQNPSIKIKELSANTGWSIGEIYRALQNNYTKPNRLKINHRNVLEFINSGFNISQIAELTGYTPRNIRYIISKLN